uniref:Uncharacterized protein n=1 Tax=Siphoviridae sp. ctMYJ33 TaxID=2825461 RepID=A0A8S5PAG8_9CAUD|nr:MAG TPA: hypothetical protein [Siphoviridae sp. ctMYJ33]
MCCYVNATIIKLSLVGSVLMIKNILFIWCRRLSSVWQMGSRPSLSLVQYLLIQPIRLFFY